MVIECIGLPGSGKTYLLKGLERALRSRGAEVDNVTELTMNRLSWKAAARLMRAGVFTDKRSGAVGKRLEEILRREGPLQSRFGIYENADYTIRSAAALIALYGKMGKSPKVYLFDEGLIHTLVKLCADCMIHDEVFLEMAAEAVKSVRGEWTVICNEISPEQCMASIRARDRHICTFDELGDSQLEMILAEYERLNECYSAHYPVLKVNRSQELQTRTDLILRGIGKL